MFACCVSGNKSHVRMLFSGKTNIFAFVCFCLDKQIIFASSSSSRTEAYDDVDDVTSFSAPDVVEAKVMFVVVGDGARRR